MGHIDVMDERLFGCLFRCFEQFCKRVKQEGIETTSLDSIRIDYSCLESIALYSSLAVLGISPPLMRACQRYKVLVLV